MVKNTKNNKPQLWPLGPVFEGAKSLANLRFQLLLGAQLPRLSRGFLCICMANAGENCALRHRY
jgi:hypothetical protein